MKTVDLKNFQISKQIFLIFKFDAQKYSTKKKPFLLRAVII